MKMGALGLAAAEYESIQAKDSEDAIGKALYAIVPGRNLTGYEGVIFRRVKSPDNPEAAGCVQAMFDGRNICLRVDAAATKELYEAGITQVDNSEGADIAKMIERRAAWLKTIEQQQPTVEPPKPPENNEPPKVEPEKTDAAEAGTPNEGFVL